MWLVRRNHSQEGQKHYLKVTQDMVYLTCVLNGQGYMLKDNEKRVSTAHNLIYKQRKSQPLMRHEIFPELNEVHNEIIHSSEAK